MTLHTPFRYKLKIVKPLKKEDIDFTFDVFKKEARNNSEKIAKAAKPLKPRKGRTNSKATEELIASFTALPKKEVNSRLKAMRDTGEISKNQARKIKRAVRPYYTNTPRRRIGGNVPRKYADYIKSEYWYSRRNRYWKTHSRVCAACGTKRYIDLHHLVYGHFGNEPDEYLVGLCREHHEGYHAENGTQRNMVRKTNNYVIKIQQEMLHR